MKRFIMIMSLLLAQTAVVVGQSSSACAIVGAHLWTERDYLLAEDTIQGTLMIQGVQKPSVAVELKLLNASSGKTISSQYLRLNKQVGSFSLQLPPRIAEGWYWIVAYHPVSQELLSSKKLFVVKSGEDFSTEQATVSLYPEGGSWVTGEKQRFLISEADGIDEVIFFSNEQPIDTFDISNGLSYGQITLDDSAAYSFRYQINEESKSIPLAPSGSPTILLEEVSSNVIVKLTNGQAKAYDLIVKSKNDSIAYKIENEPIILPKRFLPKGLKHIGLYAGNQLLSEQWYMIAPDPSMKLEITGAMSAATSSTITQQVTVQDQLGRAIPHTLVEHAYYPYFQTSDNGINHELNLITSHNRRLALASAKTEQEVNSLLVGARFLSKDLASNTSPCLPEGITVEGKLTTSAEKGQSLLLAIPGTLPGLFSTNTFGAGFSFPPILENDQEKAYLLGNPALERGAVKIELSKPTPALDLNPDELPNRAIIDHLLQLNLIRRNFQSSSSNTNAVATTSELKTYYRKPDYRISIDDFVYLQEMSTVIKEIIPYVFFKRKQIMIFSEETRKTFPGRPLLMIDGIPVSSDSAILKLEPAEIDHIDVLNSRNALLPMGYTAKNGVVAVYTKEADHVPDDAFSLRLPTFTMAGQNRQLFPPEASKMLGALSDVTKWWTESNPSNQGSSLDYQALQLGGSYVIQVAAFHPTLGLYSKKKTISINYSDDQ